jgi:hypothetical protein
VGHPKYAAVCHCKLCQRRTGSAFGFSAYFDESAVEITTGILKSFEYRSDETNRGGPMYFCPRCGTTVTWSADNFPGVRGIAAGTFDDPDWISPTVHTWTRSALHWMVLPADCQIFQTSPEWTTEAKPES